MSEERSEFSDFHLRPTLLCWCSARVLGLNFLCCGRDTTRPFIVHDRLTSSEEQRLFWAHETEAQSLGRKWWPLNEQGLIWPFFGPAWLADFTGSESHPYRGSQLQANDVIRRLETKIWQRQRQSKPFMLHVHIHVHVFKRIIFAEPSRLRGCVPTSLNAWNNSH